MNQCQSNIYLEAEEGEHCPEVQRERQELAHRYEIAYAQQCADLTGKRIPVPGPTIYLGTGLLEDILYQLTALMEKREHELLLAGAGATQASMSVTQTQTLTTTITYTQTIKQVNEMPADILTIDQKQELARLLQAVEASGKDAGKLRKAGKAVADWVFDNAVKAIPTVMPYVTQAIQNAFGA